MDIVCYRGDRGNIIYLSLFNIFNNNNNNFEI